jgi:predicted RNase H-like HicB family nuclease
MKAHATEGREMTQQQIEVQALVHEEDGSFWAEVPSCPGLFASGFTLDELVEGLREAWVLYHDDEPDDRECVDASDGSRSADDGSGTSSLTLRVPAFAQTPARW